MFAAPQFYPYYNVPVAISQAYPALVFLALPVNYVINQIVSFRCPASCGMVQIDKLNARIISIDTVASSITVDLDTSSFDAFIFFPFPQLPFTIPVGETNTLSAAVRDNTLRPGYTPV